MLREATTLVGAGHFVDVIGKQVPSDFVAPAGVTWSSVGARSMLEAKGRRPGAGGVFVLLPKGEAHTFLVSPDEPLHTLQLTTPAGFEDFAAAVGLPAPERRLSRPLPHDAVDPVALGHAAALHRIEILGPPPTL